MKISFLIIEGQINYDKEEIRRRGCDGDVNDGEPQHDGVCRDDRVGRDADRGQC